jgi:hypothetical protein
MVRVVSHESPDGGHVTTSLRNGLSRQEWVEYKDQLLRDLQFKYLEGKVLDEEGEGTQGVHQLVGHRHQEVKH